METLTGNDGRQGGTAPRMSAVKRWLRLAGIILLISVLLAGIFALDVLTPLGYAEWILYLLPILLTSFFLPRYTLKVMALSTLLIVVGFLFSPEGVSTTAAMFNRGLGIVVLLLTGVLLRDRGKLEEALRGEEERYQLLLETTKRKQAEVAMREAQERFNGIFESSRDAIAYLTFDGRFVDFNEAFVQLTGYTREELLGTPAHTLTAPECRPAEERYLQELVRTGRSIEYEQEIARKDGHRVPVSVTTFVVRHADGQSAGLAALIKDITERRRAERELRHTSEELMRKHRALARTNELFSAAQPEAARARRLSTIGQLAATVAHKIGTPLTALSGHIQLMAEDPQLSAESRQRLQTIEAQVERTSKIIQDLLLYARKPDPVFSLLDLNACLEECLILFQPELERRRVELITEFSPRIGTVTADQQQLQEIFNILIENALDAMAQGGTLSVRSRLEPGTGRIAVSFQDSGCGIEPTLVSQIFEPFFTTKKAGQGTGLGLTIARDAVRTHGGQILVESEPGKGSTFTVLLPAGEGG